MEGYLQENSSGRLSPGAGSESPFEGFGIQ